MVNKNRYQLQRHPGRLPESHIDSMYICQWTDTDGVKDSPGDRRYWMMNGLLNMKLGDTAEVVEALVVDMGEDCEFSQFLTQFNTMTK